MVLQTDVCLHGDLHAIVLGHLHGVFVHVEHVLVLRGAVHPHALNHHSGDMHFRGGNDALSDALHALLSLRGGLAVPDEVLADQRVEVDGLELNTILDRGLQIALLYPLVVQRVGVGGAAGIRQLHAGEASLVSHLQSQWAPAGEAELADAEFKTSHNCNPPDRSSV